MSYEHFDSNGNIKNGTGKKKIGLVIAAVLALIIVLANTFVITDKNEYKLIREFGRVEKVISTPGFSVKTPFIETAEDVPNEVLLYDLPQSDVITSDKKTMIVDSYVLWRVTDPLKFAQTLSCSVGSAEDRIDSIVYNATKNTISNMKQDEVIQSRDGRIDISQAEADQDVTSNDIEVKDEEKGETKITSLTESIMKQINNVENQYGIKIITVDVKKLDLPDDNKQAVYTRMISERENIAAQYTAEGNSNAQIIKNTTDKEVAIKLSDAKAKAAATEAEGEAQYMKILSDAYSDPDKADFYSYVRALDALKSSMDGGNKTIILSKDSPIVQIFNGQY
jgi:membrane protease subunit HflC